MFDKILIANRGEIACRIIATARRLGVATVAVYSDADAGARHVALADQAVHIGGPAPADSYLQGARIIAAARAAGAQAIHPGYGFLSENPDFAAAVAAAGLVFIGPSADAIRAMGLKDAAKRLMQQAGVPVVPGYHGENQDPAHLATMAAGVGYPVLIKAVAGGGGKGMRRVDRPEDFAAALDSAGSEARTAFGNPAVLIEKYVEKPRHIEVQIFGDGTRAVHLFERDCSLQRRHQKVIEEAPAPGMTATMRNAMGAAAVRAAEAIGYKGAGTVEFIVDASHGLQPSGFWFMEMNTRLQVEHPVTEAITGVDLVEWQLRVAAGEPLPLTQDQLGITGHAFEARLYAEDVAAGFLPATGRLDHLAFPADIRADSGVRPGDSISPWYDPMIAKIIVHGPTRAIALQQLATALARTEVAGTVTNLDFLGALARHPGFALGDVDTGLIARDLAALLAAAPADPRLTVAAVLAAGGLWPTAGQGGGRPPHRRALAGKMTGRAGQAGRRGPGRRALGGFTLWAPLERTIWLERAGDPVTATLITPDHDTAVVVLDNIRHACRRRGDGWWIDDTPARFNIVRHGGDLHVFAGGCHSFRIRDLLAQDAAAGPGDDVALSPMPGLVKAVFVTAGQAVAAGDRLAVLEAMKMEHTLTAGRAGTVAEVLVAAGDQVEAGAALVALEPVAG